MTYPFTSRISRRRMLKNTALAAGASFGVGSVLEACTSSPSSTSTGPSTLTIMYTDAEIPKSVRDLFMKQNPDIKINMLQYDSSRLNAMFVAGQPPDIVRIDAAAALPNVVARGVALDLTPYFQKRFSIRPKCPILILTSL